MDRILGRRRRFPERLKIERRLRPANAGDGLTDFEVQNVLGREYAKFLGYRLGVLHAKSEDDKTSHVAKDGLPDAWLNWPTYWLARPASTKRYFAGLGQNPLKTHGKVHEILKLVDVQEPRPALGLPAD